MGADEVVLKIKGSLVVALREAASSCGDQWFEMGQPYILSSQGTVPGRALHSVDNPSPGSSASVPSLTSHGVEL